LTDVVTPTTAMLCTLECDAKENEMSDQSLDVVNMDMGFESKEKERLRWA
jgi:hypothetical protein